MSVNGDKNIWKRNEIISFIQMYESLPELWNSNTKEYKEREKKLAALKKISEAFSIPTEDVRRKIHNLRCQYNAEVRKMRNKCANGDLDESKINSEWKFYEHMKFLSGAHAGAASSSSTGSTKAVVLEIDDSMNSYESDDGQEDPITTPSKPIPKRNPISERIYLPQSDVSLSGAPVEDDYRIFGEFVASELRNLNERNAKKLKLIISKAIVEVTEQEYMGSNAKEEY